MLRVNIITLLYKPSSRKITAFHLAMAWLVQCCPVPICPDSSALVPDTSAPVPKCLGSEVSWVRSVLTPE